MAGVRRGSRGCKETDKKTDKRWKGDGGLKGSEYGIRNEKINKKDPSTGPNLSKGSFKYRWVRKTYSLTMK